MYIVDTLSTSCLTI